MDTWEIIAKKELGISFTEKQLKEFQLFRDFLIEENKKYNLTGISDPQAIEIKHFLDSLSLLPHLPPETASLIDIGSGAGFPGIPLAILRPIVKITCLEATGKKATFITNVCKKLNLTNVSILNARAEEAGTKNKYREYFDVALARAVAGLPTLLEYALPFVRVGGLFIAQKTTNEPLETSAHALKELGGLVQKIIPITIPNLPERHLIFIQKTAETPKRYPRLTGIPLKNPL